MCCVQFYLVCVRSSGVGGAYSVHPICGRYVAICSRYVTMQHILGLPPQTPHMRVHHTALYLCMVGHKVATYKSVVCWPSVYVDRSAINIVVDVVVVVAELRLVCGMWSCFERLTNTYSSTHTNTCNAFFSYVFSVAFS